MVRVLEAKLLEGLSQKARYQVWWKQDENKWFGVHLARKLQTAGGGREWTAIGSSMKCVRTFMGWLIKKRIENVEDNTLILTAEEMSAEDMGFEVETGLDLKSQAEKDAIALREHGVPAEEPQPVDEEVEVAVAMAGDEALDMEKVMNRRDVWCYKLDYLIM